MTLTVDQLAVLVDIRNSILCPVGPEPTLANILKTVNDAIDKAALSPPDVAAQVEADRLRRALMWVYDRQAPDDRATLSEQRRTFSEVGKVLAGQPSEIDDWSPNSWDPSVAICTASRPSVSVDVEAVANVIREYGEKLYSVPLDQRGNQFKGASDTFQHLRDAVLALLGQDARVEK